MVCYSPLIVQGNQATFYLRFVFEIMSPLIRKLLQLVGNVNELQQQVYSKFVVFIIAHDLIPILLLNPTFYLV